MRTLQGGGHAHRGGEGGGQPNVAPPVYTLA
jgi:hypothetical protein